MSQGALTLNLAFAAFEQELDWFVDWILSAEERPWRELPLVVEYRLAIHWNGAEGIRGSETRDLGVVNEDYAMQQAQQLRRDHGATVRVQRRKALRGEWISVPE